MGVDVGAETAVEGVGAVLFAAAVVIDPVERHIPFLERADGQAAAGEVVDGNAWFVLHEHRRAVIPHAFVVAVADVEDLRNVDVAVQLERAFAAEVLVFQIDVVGRLRAEADVFAADQHQVLVVPVRQIGAFFWRAGFGAEGFALGGFFDWRRLRQNAVAENSGNAGQ
ncbi:hypothetical protein D3C81_1262960 [compost metagenome]